MEHREERAAWGIVRAVRGAVTETVRIAPLLAALLVASAPSAAAQEIVAYEVPAGTVGTQAFAGALGMDFDVLLDIDVTDLGVFDSGSDGLALAITARIYDRDTFEELASIAFGPGDDGELVGGSRLKPIAPPLELPAGSRCTIVAEGYGAAEPLWNRLPGVTDPGLSTNAGPCSLAFVGGGRYGVTPGLFPASPDAGPPNRYGAGTFRFEPLETPTPQAGPTVAYVVPELTFGNQAFGGALGMDFDVRSGIEVTRLGVFDSGSDGLLLTITARLYNREAQEALATLVFTPEDPGDPVDGSVFKDLDEPLLLPVGFKGSIVASGYGADEMNGNAQDPLLWTVDTGGCAIVQVGSGRWGAVADAFPATVDTGVANKYASGTFEFRLAQTPVEPPGTPTGLAAAPADGRANLSWTAPAGGTPVVGYNVYQTIPGPRRKLNAALVSATSYEAAGLLNGVAYCFEVTSAAAGGLTSDPTPEACATPSTTAVPATRLVAYEVEADTPGNQELGSIGLDFQANSRILITRLGAFDDGSDGLRAPITVRLLDTRTRAELAHVELTPEDPGELVGGSRFKALPLAVELPAGFAATIAAEGYGPTERSGTTAIPPLSVAFDDGDCVITRLGARTGAAGAVPGAFPATFDPTNLHAAGTFEYGLRPGSSPPPKDGGIAYEIPAGTAGIQDFGGALGLDFDVRAPVRVLRLGVFDDGSDGLGLPITARLYDRRVQSVLATLDFTPEDPGELVGGSRFKDLPEPLLLLDGFQGTMTASGYGAGELNGNATLTSHGAWSVDGGGCLLAFVGAGRYGVDPTLLPGVVDQGPPNRYAAGTFLFEPVSPSEVPQPPTNLVAAPGPAGRVNLTWTAPTGGLAPQGYNIYRTAPAPVEQVNPTLVTATSFTTGAFANGVTVCFEVRTVAGGLESGPSVETCTDLPGGTRRPGHYIAYEVPQGILGNTPAPGAVGMDFDVEREVVVTRLGAFDDGGFGFALTVSVVLYDRADGTELARLEFSSDDPGDLIGASRFKDLEEPVGLPAGFQGSIVAEGYDAGERYGAAPGTWYTERGRCALSFVGTGRTGAEGAFPEIPDVGPANRFAAGTFEFRPVEESPGEPRAGIAYEVPAFTAGTQAFEGSLGMDFDTYAPVRVTALGVFDDGSDGLARTISARLYDRETREVLASTTFTTEDPGELIGGSRFKDMDPPLELPRGFRGTIVAEGYGAGEQNGNAGALAPLWTTDDGGCVLSFVGSGRYAFPVVPGAFPAARDGGPPNRYAAGTFMFEPSEGTGKIFHRGDPDDDGAINITDGIYILNYLFLGGPEPTCLEAANVDDDAMVNITDGIYLLNYLFLGGSEPAAPGPVGLPCGPDPTGSPSDLGCVSYTSCQ